MDASQERVRVSKEEEGDPCKSELSTKSVAQKSCRTTRADMQIVECPGCFLVLDEIDSEMKILNNKTFKAWILYAETKDIYKELRGRLKECSKHHLLTVNGQTHFPRIELGDFVDLNVGSDTIEQNLPNNNNDDKPLLTTIYGNKKFTKNDITRPNDILKDTSRELRPSKHLDIPNLEFQLCLSSDAEGELPFNICVKPSEGQPQMLHYIAVFEDLPTALQENIRNDAQKLADNRDFIIRKLEDVNTIISKLASAGILNDTEQMNLFKNLINHNDFKPRIRELLDILLVHKESLQPFITALEQTELPGNIEIAHKLSI